MNYVLVLTSLILIIIYRYKKSEFTGKLLYVSAGILVFFLLETLIRLPGREVVPGFPAILFDKDFRNVNRRAVYLFAFDYLPFLALALPIILYKKLTERKEASYIMGATILSVVIVRLVIFNTGNRFFWYGTSILWLSIGPAFATLPLTGRVSLTGLVLELIVGSGILVWLTKQNPIKDLLAVMNVDVSSEPDYGTSSSVTVNQKSFFDGGLAQLVGNGILWFFALLFTIGIAYPWVLCSKQKWIAKHTVIEGRRLRFTGNGGQLIGKWILWGFLSFITAGIYLFWMNLAVRKWITKHTVYADTGIEGTHPTSVTP